MAKLSGEAESFAKEDESHHVDEPKNRISIFYDVNKIARRKAIKHALDKFAFDKDDRYRLSIKWNEMDSFVISSVKFLKGLGVIENNKLFINKLPSAFIEKLFSVINEWQMNGQIYLPTMASVLMQAKTELSAAEQEALKKYLYWGNTENIKKLHIPLTWISYLRR